MLVESFRMAFGAICQNRLRSALTALGILIGIGSVIAMVSIGRGAAERVRGEIARLGSDLLTLSVGQSMRGGKGASISAQPFDYSDVEAVRQAIGGLRLVAPLASRPMLAVARRSNWTATAIGTENDYFKAKGWQIAHGRLFTELETYNGRPVCIVGQTVSHQLFGRDDAVGESLRIGTVPCTVIGVLEARGQAGSGDDGDNVIAVPFDTFQRRIQGAPHIQSIVMGAYPESDMTRLKTSVIGLMRERRKISFGAADDFTVLDMRQVAQSMTAASTTLTLFLGAIAAVSLVVGGIGIMNIMLVSVTERTREIGVRLAIGAAPSQIRLQFLIEAVLLTAMGGTAGILFGICAAALLAPALGLPWIIDASVIASASLVTIALGLGFGYAPAAAAARLDPVVALRHE